MYTVRYFGESKYFVIYNSTVHNHNHTPTPRKTDTIVEISIPSLQIHTHRRSKHTFHHVHDTFAQEDEFGEAHEATYDQLLPW